MEAEFETVATRLSQIILLTTYEIEPYQPAITHQSSAPDKKTEQKMHSDGSKAKTIPKKLFKQSSVPNLHSFKSLVHPPSNAKRNLNFLWSKLTGVSDN